MGDDLLSGVVSAGASLLGADISSKEADKIAAENIAYQKEFAQNGIQWKVADAKAAGINPLAALGAATNSFSNVVGDDGAMGKGVAQAGQDLARAIHSTRSADDQAAAQRKTQLDLESLSLDNDLKRTRLAAAMATANQPGNGPPTPTVNQRYLIDGQQPTTVGGTAGTALTKEEPMKRVVSAPGQPSSEPGAVPEVGYARTPAGGFSVIPSEDFMKRTSNDQHAMTMFNWRNRWLPRFWLNESPPPVPAGEGRKWHYDLFYDQYLPYKWRQGYGYVPPYAWPK